MALVVRQHPYYVLGVLRYAGWEHPYGQDLACLYGGFGASIFFPGGCESARAEYQTADRAASLTGVWVGSVAGVTSS